MSKVGMSLIVALRRLATRIRTLAAAELAEYDLTVIHGAVLRAIAHNEPCTHAFVAAECDLERSNLTPQLERLTNRGYVRRVQSDGDRRVYLLELTDEGKAIMPDINRIWNAIAHELTDGIPMAEQRELLRMLVDAEQRLRSH